MLFQLKEVLRHYLKGTLTILGHMVDYLRIETNLGRTLDQSNRVAFRDGDGSLLRGGRNGMADGEQNVSPVATARLRPEAN